MHKILLNSFLIILLCIMLISLARVLGGKSQEEANISKLQSVLNQEQVQNKQLKGQYSYYSSTDYVEQVSRDQLGLAKKGEVLVVLPTDTLKQGATSSRYYASKSTSPINDWISLLLSS